MNKPNTTRKLALGLLIVLVLVASTFTYLADWAHSAEVAVPNSGHLTNDCHFETIDLSTIHPADRKFYDCSYPNPGVSVGNAEYSPSNRP